MKYGLNIGGRRNEEKEGRTVGVSVTVSVTVSVVVTVTVGVVCAKANDEWATGKERRGETNSRERRGGGGSLDAGCLGDGSCGYSGSEFSSVGEHSRWEKATNQSERSLSRSLA
jgi:hypothetical protein